MIDYEIEKKILLGEQADVPDIQIMDKTIFDGDSLSI